MKTDKIFAIIIFFLLFTFVATGDISAQKSDDLKPKNVLMLFAPEPDSPVNDDVMQTLQKKLIGGYRSPVDFFVDYVQITGFNDEKHYEEFFGHINKKYAKTKFDLLISAGPGLFPLVEKLPKDSIEINHEYTFFEQYYIIIIVAINFIVIETLLIIFLFSLYKKQKKQTEVLIRQENRYHELVDYNRLSELSEITASLSHQLNQPLTAILSNSQAALRFLSNNKYEKQLFEEILSNIVEDVKRASAIIISLRNMMKKEAIAKRKVNINGLAHDVFSLFNSQASVKDILVEADIDKTNPFVIADTTLIQQVILNLLLNASEALENKEGEKKIVLKTGIQGDFVLVSVSDNGYGIAKTLETEIFKPFFTTKSKGLGIGLAICRSIVEDHEGKLVFENNKSGGATFSFKLKMAK